MQPICESRKRTIVLLPLIFLLFCVAHAYNRQIFDGIIVFKSIYFNIVAALLILASSILFLVTGRQKSETIHKVRLPDMAIALFAFYFIIHSLLFEVEFTENVWAFLLVLLSYFFFRDHFSDLNYGLVQKSIIFFLILSGLVECVIGLLQLCNIIESLNPYFKITGAFHNPGPYAIYLASILSFSLFIALFLKPASSFDFYIKLLAISFCIMAIAILPFTESRTGWISFVITLPFILRFHKQIRDTVLRFINSRIKIFIVISAVSLVLVLAYLYKKQSADGRLFIWELCKDLIMKNPIVGHGFNSFSKIYMDEQVHYFSSHYNNEVQVNLADKINYAFNDYLQIWIELGVGGLLLFLFIICSLWSTGKRDINSNMSFERIIFFASASGLIAILASGLTSYPFSGIPIFLNLFLFISVLSGQSRTIYLLSGVKKNVHFVFAFVSIIGTSYFLIYQYQSFLNKKTYFIAGKLVNEGRYAEATDMLQTTGKQLYQDQYGLATYSKILSLTKKFRESNEFIKILSRNTSDPLLYAMQGNNYCFLGDSINAEKSYTLAVFMVPNRLYPRYLLAKFYFSKKNIFKAILTTHQLFDMPEKVPSLDTWFIKNELKDSLKKYENYY